MIVERHNPSRAVRPTSYSQVVRAGNTIYVSGQVAWDDKGEVVGKGDIVAQAEQVFGNLQHSLELAGGGFKDVVALTTYVTNSSYGAAVRDARIRRFPEAPPATTSLVVNALAGPELLLEVEAVAVLSPKVRRQLNPADARGQRPGYAQAVLVDDIVYMSGQVARSRDGSVVGPGDISAQAEQAFANVRDVLQMAGTDVTNIAMIRNFLTNPVLFSPFFEVYLKHVGQHYPANTTVMVAALAQPELMVETEAVASAQHIELIEPAWRGKPQGYSMAAKVGNVLYISGQVSRNREGTIVGPGNIAMQVDQALQNMGIVLAEAGVSYKDVVKLNAFLTNAAFFPYWREGRQRYFPKEPPASTGVAVPALARPDFLIEVEAIAVLP